jgi:hypothetical protein
VDTCRITAEAAAKQAAVAHTQSSRATQAAPHARGKLCQPQKLWATRETTGDVGGAIAAAATCLTLFECVHLCTHVDASDAQHAPDLREATLHKHTRRQMQHILEQVAAIRTSLTIQLRTLSRDQTLYYTGHQ